MHLPHYLNFLTLILSLRMEARLTIRGRRLTMCLLCRLLAPNKGFNGYV